MIRSARRVFHVVVVALAASVVSVRALHAQIGTATDIITGRVVGPDSQPLEGARVEVTSIETQIVRTRSTNARGQYTILFPGGGGNYSITVRFLGMAPVTVNLARQGDEDRMVADFALQPAPTTLSRVVTRAQPNRAQNPQRPEPGNLERALTPDMLQRLPVDAGDLAAVATLAPGVVGVGGTDSTAAGFSVAGQPTTQNATTLDGLSFESLFLPPEAIRVSRVITNTFDVSRGQFTGGQIATTTRGGSNFVQGGFTYSMRDPSLQWNEDETTIAGRGYDEHTLSGGLGGPLRKNVLFAFGSFQLRRRDDPLLSLASIDAATRERVGVSPDSITRFLSALDGYGLAPMLSGIPRERQSDNISVLGKIDWTMTERHNLSVRGDWRGAAQGAARIGTLSVPHNGGDSRNRGAGGMVTLTSHFGTGVINEFRGYVSSDLRTADPYLLTPQGRVRVGSVLADGSRSITTFEFGGNAGLPQDATTRGLELTDEVSLITSGGAHRVKLGGLVNASAFDQLVTTNRYGSYVYNSLFDFETGNPAVFTRSLSTRSRTGAAYNSAVYLGDVWRVRRGLQVDLGVRVEASQFEGEPRHNPLVEDLFGHRTDVFPSEVHASPRLGFSWTPTGARNVPRFTIRGGVGEFRARPATAMFAAALDANGLPDAEGQLVCIGDDVPSPDWTGFRGDPASIPTTCVDGGSGTTVSGRRSNVTLFDSRFGAPRSWRASLGGQKRFRDRYGMSVDAVYALGTNLPTFTDLNLVPAPAFTLPDERDRPVFAPASGIVAGTGALSIGGSRIHQDFGQVLLARPDGQSRTMQVTVSGNGIARIGLIFNASYTAMWSRDQSSFSCCSAGQGYSAPTTSGDPRVREWAPNDLERRHSALAAITYPVKPWLELTTIGRLTSGARFTPFVGGDINGDGSRNDRAFIFDPANVADTAVAAGMRRILARDDRVGDCLRSQLGRVAGRNSCQAPWNPTLDFQANFRPESFGLERRLTLSLIAVNTLAGLDQLFNSGNLHGWGQPYRPDATLLHVRGFDSTTRRFRYEVNERFGHARGGGGVIAPFILALQAKLSIGPDPARDRIRALFAAGGARNNSARPGQQRPNALSPENILARVNRMIPNPILAILAMRDTLKLTPAQDTALIIVADSLAARNERLAKLVSEALSRAGPNADPITLMGLMQPRLADARGNVEKALDSAERILTPEQWSLLPDRITNPIPGQTLRNRARRQERQP